MTSKTTLPKSKSLASITLNGITVKVGDIFTGSWGYDQTNVDFYEVVHLSGKSTAYFRRMGTRAVSHGRTHDNMIPSGPHRWDTDIKRVVLKVYQWGSSPAHVCCTIGHVYCKPWDGQAQYATNSIYGH